MPGRFCLADFHNFWRVGSYRRRNYRCQIWTRLVKGFWSYGCPKSGVSHWFWSSPLQQCYALPCYTVINWSPYLVSDTMTGWQQWNSCSVVVVGEVENGYHGANAYHNAVHATDVTQAMNCYINERKVCTRLLFPWLMCLLPSSLLWLRSAVVSFWQLCTFLFQKNRNRDSFLRAIAYVL